MPADGGLCQHSLPTEYAAFGVRWLVVDFDELVDEELGAMGTDAVFERKNLKTIGAAFFHSCELLLNLDF